MDIDKPEHIRMSVMLTKPYIEGIKKLVEAGLFLNTGDMQRASLRLMFEKHGLNLFEFSLEQEEKPQPS